MHFDEHVPRQLALLHQLLNFPNLGYDAPCLERKASPGFFTVHPDRIFVGGSRQGRPAGHWEHRRTAGLAEEPPCFEIALPLFRPPVHKPNRDVNQNPLGVAVAIQYSLSGLVLSELSVGAE